MKIICILLIAVLVTYSNIALSKTFYGYEPSASLRLQNTGFDLQEKDVDGRELVHETGNLIGFTSRGALTKGRYEFSTDFSYITSDSITYDGETQAGDFFQTDVKTEVIDISVTATDKVYSYKNIDYFIGMGLGYRHWQRDILGRGTVAGLFETNDWTYFLFNHKLNIKLSNKNSIILNAMYRDFIAASVTTNLAPVGTTAKTTKINLKGGKSYQLGINFKRTIKPNAHFVAGLTFDEWSFKRSSQTRDSIIISQPKNTTEQLNFSLGLNMRF